MHFIFILFLLSVILFYDNKHFFLTISLVYNYVPIKSQLMF